MKKALGQFRALHAAAGAQPEACLGLCRQGADRLIGELADCRRAAHDARSLSVTPPRLAADVFLAKFLGDGHIRGLLRLTPPEPRQDRALLREVKRVLMAAFRVGV